jgi:hypothetical protein
MKARLVLSFADLWHYMTTVVTNSSIGVMRNIQLRDAKAALSAVVDDAAHGNASVITRHGKPGQSLEWG